MLIHCCEAATNRMLHLFLVLQTITYYATDKIVYIILYCFQVGFVIHDVMKSIPFLPFSHSLNLVSQKELTFILTK